MENMPNNNETNLMYQELARKLREEGWYIHPTLRILLELGLHLTIGFGGLVAALALHSPLIRAGAFILSAVGVLGAATNTHTSSHFATSSNSFINRFLTYCGFTFLLGTSASYWWHKHSVIHHPAPNLIGVDDDADFMPFFATNDKDLRQSRGICRLFYRIQWIFVPFVLCFAALNIQREGWAYLLPILFDGTRRRAIHWIDLAVLLLHWTIWLFLPITFFGLAKVSSIYLLEMMLLGYGLFITLGPAHLPEEAVVFCELDKNEDFVLRQTMTTVNFRTGFVGRLLCSGLEYQIEHHLFPGISHVFYPRLSLIVRQFCEENGYPYRTLGWAEAVWKSLTVFRRPKSVLAQLLDVINEMV
jgi:fatty acid desaturase